MKKILLIAALFISTGVISSCTKENEVTPTTTIKKSADVGDDFDSECGACLGTGDGGYDLPTPPKKPKA